jgi:hypothetical protein
MLSGAQKPSLFFDQMRSKITMFKLLGLKRFLRAKDPDHRHRDQPSSGRYHAAFPRRLEPER